MRSFTRNSTAIELEGLSSQDLGRIATVSGQQRQRHWQPLLPKDRPSSRQLCPVGGKRRGHGFGEPASYVLAGPDWRIRVRASLIEKVVDPTPLCGYRDGLPDGVDAHSGGELLGEASGVAW